MKTYMKPRLVALSLTGNDDLCGTCAIDAVEPDMDAALKRALELAGGVDIDIAFASSADDCGVFLSEYCKHAPTTNSILFAS